MFFVSQTAKTAIHVELVGKPIKSAVIITETANVVVGIASKAVLFIDRLYSWKYITRATNSICGIWLSIHNNEKVICSHPCKKLTREDVSEVPGIGILVLALLGLVGASTTNTAFKELPFLIDEAKAIKHKTSRTPIYLHMILRPQMKTMQLYPM
ncbi:MAG: hypothetical protein WAZ77_17185 [Candidatus Nitrosopolaris sp.]|jgi:hypothetical protein